MKKASNLVTRETPTEQEPFAPGPILQGVWWQVPEFTTVRLRDPGFPIQAVQAGGIFVADPAQSEILPNPTRPITPTGATSRKNLGEPGVALQTTLMEIGNDGFDPYRRIAIAPEF